ncbi:hypothetical protein Krac_1628 [Ktedonobacter racemifer DSM 44963]|uniref:Uncharacterized protein n=1 Tax=Ktedonobacter racemifer DSM 44963 TaxID=485913 RepID=D6U2L4_KTERA|nr:hypothetical protein Krac_1628 [Ktedonobacter racemifer DSM 44963]
MSASFSSHSYNFPYKWTVAIVVIFGSFMSVLNQAYSHISAIQCMRF